MVAALAVGRAGRPNVLILSASRKVLLVRAFQEAVRAAGAGQVLAADIDPFAAALRVADGARIVPRSEDPAFVPALLELCAADQVGLVVPTRDEELPKLAAARDRFLVGGTLVLVSAPAPIETCADKRRFSAAVRAAGLATPATYEDPATVRLPAFVKPRRGKGGDRTARVDTPAELAAALATAGADAIVQELIDAPEFTIDVFLDLAGQPISCVPRERIAVVAGESVVSRTVRDPELSAAALQLCTAIGLIGHVTVQAFRTPDSILFIEVNPRYGGAANLGFQAGAPSPEYALALARGERVAPRLGRYEAGLVMLRYADDLLVRDADLVRGGS
ncbi:MAG: ATP-grasp domain-containing protein [Candidatus Limnocylindrales bacterium]